MTFQKGYIDIDKPTKTNEVIPLEPIKEWKDEISPELEQYLDTKPTFGLTPDQVSERLAKFGRNELEEKKKSKIKHFLSFCKYLLVLLILFHSNY